MLRRILVPLDGSEFAEIALRTAASLARRIGAEVRLVCVLEMPPVFVFPEYVSPDRVWADRYLADVADRIRAPGIGLITTSAREGRVTDQIELEASAWDADLIVMSTHGRGGASRMWMGSVADRCIRVCRRPVLLVRATEDGEATAELDVTRVVVALDGSAAAEVALPPAIVFAKVFGVAVLLLRASPQAAGIMLDEGAETAELSRRLLDEGRREAGDYLAEQVARLRSEGVEATGLVITEPGTAQEIADRAPGELVVMSTHGHGRMDRALFGSIADKVMRTAPGPVLVIPPVGGGENS